MADNRLLAAKREVEWRRCSEDLRYFLENYWHIEWVEADKHGVFRKRGWRLFKLRDYQVEDLELIRLGLGGDPDHLRQVWLKARQVGQTTLVIAAAFWDLYFHDDHQWIVAAQTEDDAQETLLNRVKVPYRMLPEWMKERGSQLETQNMEEMRFQNGSVMAVIPATGAAGRGGSRHGMIFDETAFVEQAADLFAAVEPQTYGPMFVFSTANGMGNWFHETWLESERTDSEWVGNFHPWSVVPGRDERWYERTKRRMRATPHLFYQEYPATPSEAFAKSGRTAFDMEILEKQHWCEPEDRYDLMHMLHLIREGEETLDVLEQSKLLAGEVDVELHVWEHPYVLRDERGYLTQKPNFVVACDVAEGLPHGDRTSIVIWDANTWEVVATSLSHMPVEDLGEVLEWLGYWYYSALVLVERNNHGILPLQYLKDHRYPRLYRMEAFAQQARGKYGNRSQRYGWHTNKASKPKMVKDFNAAIRDDVVTLHDARFKIEASTFISDGRGSYEAVEGNHDDHVDSHMMGWQGCLDVGQYPIVWQDPEPGPITKGQVTEIALRRKLAPGPQGIGGPIGQRRYRSGVMDSFVLDNHA